MLLKLKDSPVYGLFKNVIKLGFCPDRLAARGRQSHVCQTESVIFALTTRIPKYKIYEVVPHFKLLPLYKPDF